jgi:uncharacterized protein
MQNTETVLITGGSGLIGQHLTIALSKRGYRVLQLSRKFAEENTYLWNPKTGFINPEAIEQADHIIHLAGANIGEKKWTQFRKQEILDSRVLTARILLNTIKSTGRNIKTYISASATGYYDNSAKIHTEMDNAGKSFLSDVCVHAESMANEFDEAGIRTVKIRTGLVLAKDGGILPRFIQIVKMGMGISLGSGKQGLPWIHIDDLCEIYCQAIENTEFKGIYNAVAPETLTNKTFTRALTLQMEKPFWPFRIPSLPIRWVLGEQSDLILKGTHVQPKRLLDMGFKFKYNEIGSALESFTELY